MRVVAGEFKGRRLAGPEGTAARPTSDKVREALFSILGDLDGARVLDLFAGTGALAIEAISRGAASAVLVERDHKMVGVARKNIAATVGAGRADLRRGDALAQVALDGGKYNLVFIDPPYAKAESLAAKLAAALPPILAPGARVVTESDRRSPIDFGESDLKLRSEHRYGDTLIRIFDAP